MLTATSAEEWEDIVSRSYVPLATDTVSPRFRATIDRRTCGDVAISRVRALAPTRVVRTDRLVSDSPSDDLLLSLPIVGGGCVRQAGRSADFVAGSGTFYEAAAPYELEFPVATDQLVVQAPRRMLSATRHQISCSAARQISSPPTLGLVTRMVSDVLDVGSDDLTAGADRVGQAIALLVDTLFDPVGTGARHEQRTALFDTVTADIRLHASDLDLSPGWLARRHHVSVRHLQTLFAEHESSPAAYIRSERLAVARRLLDDSRCQHVSIGEIGVRAGWADQTTFTRAFRARYDCSPGEYRREACANRR